MQKFEELRQGKRGTNSNECRQNSLKMDKGEKGERGRERRERKKELQKPQMNQSIKVSPFIKNLANGPN